MNLRKLAGYALCLVALIVATDWVVAQQAQQETLILGGAAPPRSNQRDLLYVVAAGGAINNLAYGGEGVLVFDAGRNHMMIKRIPLPYQDNPAWQGRERVDAISATVDPPRLYVARTRNMWALDLMTEKLLWESHVAGRIAVSPDGKKLYAPHGTEDRNTWTVVDTATGKDIAMIKAPQTTGQHNTIVSPDGTKVFMSGTLARHISVGDTATNQVIQVVGPFSQQNRVYTINGAATLVYVTMVDLLGFEIGDVKTGKVIHRVEVPGYGANRARVATHGTASHGVAMSPDEKEVWVVDAVNGGLVHVFDNTAMPPKYMTTIKLRHEHPGWISFSLDGKRVYPSTGDIIDVATKRVVGGLFDEFGRSVQSEAIVDVRFSMSDRKATMAGNSFGVGQVRPARTSSGN